MEHGPANQSGKQLKKSYSKPARWWIATIPEGDYTRPDKPSDAVYVRGQLEQGDGGFRHYQLVIQFKRPVRRSHLSKWITRGHYEPTRSEAALDYVWKEDTRIGDPFEDGIVIN